MIVFMVSYSLRLIIFIRRIYIHEGKCCAEVCCIDEVCEFNKGYCIGKMCDTGEYCCKNGTCCIDDVPCCRCVAAVKFHHTHIPFNFSSFLFFLLLCTSLIKSK